MRNYLLIKHLIFLLKEYIFIFLTATIFILILSTKSFGNENVFTVNNVEVKGNIDLNFKREKYLNIAFRNSFKILANKILLMGDLKNINDVNLKEIKNLIKSFRILEESYSKDEYNAKFKIYYSEEKVKKFFIKKNISISRPEKITAIFYPILFVNNEMLNHDENFFYKKWVEVEINNELINFILPLEDLEDVSEIIKKKNNPEDFDVNIFVNKYDTKNYVFAFMDYHNKKLDVHLKTNFNGNKTSKNISYELKDINDVLILDSILKEIKLVVTDIWKEENLINLLMPLSIQVKFQHTHLENLYSLKRAFDKITIIDNYSLEEFNINSSFFKIYYYTNPKKLKTELIKFGYNLKNEQGLWQLYLNE